MKVDLSGKNILVTGGGGYGVGAGMCQAIIEAGGKLIVNDLTESATQDAVKRYDAELGIAADIAEAKQAEWMMESIRKSVGVLHGLVNNAGIGLIKPAFKVEEAEYQRLFQVNLQATWRLSKLFAQQLLEARQVGHIVNVSSVNAHATARGYAIYAATKAGIEGLTRGMALDLGKYHIRCNAIAPGYVHSEQGFDLIGTWTEDPQAWVENLRTNHQALPYFVDSLDCGRMATFLLTDLAKSITGQTIYVDGGLTSMLFSNDLIG
ncbi:MAG: SDR family oxidoreductase [Bacteroidota bacterium]